MNPAMDLDAASLSALLAVIETGSFTEAAKQLRISQPAVSLAVKRLEERLGTVLVVRTRGRVAASRPGELLAIGARLSFEALANAVGQIANERVVPTGRVVLGVHESLAAYALPTFMAHFVATYPQVELQLWNGRSRDVEAELTAGRVDLALIVNPQHVPDLVLTPLFDDSVELFHALPTKQRDAAAIVAAHALLYVPQLVQSQEILRQLQKKRIASPRLLPCGSLELVKSLVLDGVGVGILPRRVAEHRVVRRAMRSLCPPLPLYRDHVALARRYDVPPTAAIRVVIDELTAHCKAPR